jgi:hypothetical protein
MLAFCAGGKTGTTTIFEILKNAARHFLQPQFVNQSLRALQKRCSWVPPSAPMVVRRTVQERVGPQIESGCYSHAPWAPPIAQHLCWNTRFISFTTIRNPWDRVISCFVNKAIVKSMWPPQSFGVERLDDVTFERFLHFVKSSVHKKGALANTHFVPLSLKCKPASGSYSLVLRMESFTADLRRLFALIGPSWVAAADTLLDTGRVPTMTAQCLGSLTKACQRWLPLILNASSHAELRRRFFTSSTRDLVADLYADDIALGGYEF